MPAAMPSFLTCQRCMQPLRLDESLTDEALNALATTTASASSTETAGTSGGGLTRSNYDVIASMLADNDDHSEKKDVTRPNALPAQIPPPPAALQTAVAEHYKHVHDEDKTSHASPSPNSLSARLSLHTRLFDLASAFVPSTSAAHDPTGSSASSSTALGIDHPMCVDCSDFCLSVLRNQIDDVRRERAALKEWSRQLEGTANDDEAADTMAKMEAEIVDLQDQVRKLTDAVYQSEKTRTGLEEELRLLEVEERELEGEEAEFWESHSKLLASTSALESTRASLQRSLANQQATLDRLNATNVFFDVFSIGNESSHVGAHDAAASAPTSTSSRKRTGASHANASSATSSLATINGLRFGRVSSNPAASTVEWNEVNAAWGQVALLVDVLRRKLASGGNVNKQFQGWRICPRGSTSYLKKLSAQQQQQQQQGGVEDAASTTAASSSEDIYELYHPGPWTPITRMLHSRRFDAAMVGILDCTAQLFAWAAAPSPTTSSPPPRMIHLVNGDKIGDVSIRLAGAFGFTSEESWSRACRYLLVNLQVLMNWATKDEAVPVPLPDGDSTPTS